jgi:hypothetical protein
LSGSPASLLDGWVRRGITQPVAAPVPSDDARFLASKGLRKVAARVLRRQLEVALSGQAGGERQRIEPGWRRALWIHAEAPQVGDALMDLAPRSLLAERGIAVDLLAPAVTAALFAGDRGFARVHSDPAQVRAAEHDFAIVDSRSWKALAAKRRCAPALPWVSLKGDYLGYDYHRGLFVTRRLAALLGIELDRAAESGHARQKLCLDLPADVGASTAPARIGLALGGVRPERTYGRWPEVAAGLHARGARDFVLFGSENGRAAADAVQARLPEGSCLDLVARTDLHRTWRAIGEAALLLAADGGLMHLGLATSTPVVALFNAQVDPAWRLPPDFRGDALRAEGDEVSGIEPGRVQAAALGLLGRAALDVSPGR